MQGYKISTDTNEMDLDVIHGFISSTYWAKGIPRSAMEKAIRNSLCFGVLTETGEQVGFARLITDKATFAYLADVFILPEHRGLVLSKWLMQNIMAPPELQALRRMLLVTRDAQGLYAQFGFKEVVAPKGMMQILRPDVYQPKPAKT
ncbi:GCN5-related N-acetyltransferase [Paraglaciecola sp. T6c]|uniref:GNAT family N-acetyltransferase n=1 Tax=Pseudoalteromonas atlantica (strain T6c / ATCC BAA-1087) TaxID=3042615 RepID=UPI00005C6289|nr:GNAT family N-acetyltransferase [Paraglaciecola sp. T6c]ABG41247.1 GCN5-related N-acetyltransferase [Paraglaciecola sp. T6c]